MSFALFCQAKLNQMGNYHAAGSSGENREEGGGMTNREGAALPQSLGCGGINSL